MYDVTAPAPGASPAGGPDDPAARFVGGLVTALGLATATALEPDNRQAIERWAGDVVDAAAERPAEEVAYTLVTSLALAAAIFGGGLLKALKANSETGKGR